MRRALGADRSGKCQSPALLRSGDNPMLDLLFVVIMLFGCVSSLAYVRGCERL
ncbi:MAG: hypothetical protein WDO69_13780 [Pseudomonadota bacterium]